MHIMIPFLLNCRPMTSELPAGLPVLDLLRRELGLNATKSGCREGDCGACSVLLGAPSPDGGLRYRMVNSCLLPLGALAGKHLVTLEGLNGDALTPVQSALVEEGGVQCGFCTPGVVIALTAHLLNSDSFELRGVLESLDGNLCRCTGYMGIKRAGELLNRSIGRGLPPVGAQRIAALVEAGVLPSCFSGTQQLLVGLPPAPRGAGDGLLVAGGTDLFARSTDGLLDQRLSFTDYQPELVGIELRDGRCLIGAATTVEELLESPLLQREIPHLHQFLAHVASTPVRDRATLGGNLVNASPIGDLSICLLALDADLLLQQQGKDRRLPLRDFFLGYKQLQLEAGEQVVRIEFTEPAGHVRFNFEKVALREYLDIASVNTACGLELEGRRIRHVSLSAGGVAATPLLLEQSAAMLTGEEIDANLVLAVAEMAAREVNPIDDVHGSARYKRLLLCQLVIAHFVALTPELIPELGDER
jgi:xanthine dehydrogenase small subunit